MTGGRRASAAAGVGSDFGAFCGIDALWARLLPHTPFGRAAKARLAPLTERAALEALHDRTDAARSFLAALDGDRVTLDRIHHHLERLPRFPEMPRDPFDEVELFQLKKFLFNHGALLALLPDALRGSFGLRPLPPELSVLLGTGRQGDETFHVADAYDPALAATRAALRENDAAARRLRDAHEEALRARWGFAFEGRAFLLVPRARLGDAAAASDLLDVEPWDAAQLCVRPRPSAEGLRLAEERQALLGQERALEAKVLAALSGPLREALPAFLEQARAVEELDLALARARLAREAGLVRPDLDGDGLRVEGGRHLPTEELCAGLGSPYTPLDADLSVGPTVVFGSNMGGKTVVLKTLGFLQLAAQLGLFVPARRFSTRVFRRFHYVGEGRGREEEARGLSGFGFEIRRFAEAHADFGGETLALFDEFARTTSSREAEALLSAILEELAARPRAVVLFSTHFRGVRRLPGVRYLRMGGLDRSRLDLGEEGGDLAARIRRIDALMRFCLEPDDPAERRSDAVAVARLLGLSPALARRAEELIHDED